jgi:protein-tyrosine phosphatase
MLEVRAEFLEAALGAVREHFGSFDGYLTEGLGLGVVEVESLRRTLRGEN